MLDNEKKYNGMVNEDAYTQLTPAEDVPVQAAGTQETPASDGQDFIIIEETPAQTAYTEAESDTRQDAYTAAETGGYTDTASQSTYTAEAGGYTDTADQSTYTAEAGGYTDTASQSAYTDAAGQDGGNNGREAEEWTRPQNYGQQNSGRYASYEFSKEETPAQKPPKKKKHIGGLLAKAAAAGLVFGLVAYGGVALLNHFVGPLVVKEKVSTATPVINTTTTSAGKDTASGDLTTTTARVYDVSDVTEAVMPSVVAIVNKGTTEITTFWGTQSQDFQSSGSGVIVGSNEEELLIATNNHVVNDAKTLEITFADDTKASATLKGQSSEMDLAVVAVKLSDLDDDTMEHVKIATLGDSTAVKVGEPAIAIGNALGYGQSVTFGVISALDREVTVKTDSTYGFGNSETITSKLIQTDAAINPGNSGGALFNINGEVIGINSVKYASSEVEGMGYAIPITAAQPILDELMNRKTKEKVDESEKAYMGIRGAEVTSEAQSIYGMPKGAYIVYVEDDSAAEKAGIKKGDIIVKFDDTSISTYEELQEQLQYYAAGETVDLVVARSESGEYVNQTLHITLGSWPEKNK